MSMRRTVRQPRSQGGQVLVVFALTATLLLGFAALAIDLSVGTQNRRVSQNVTDAGALAGVRDFGSFPTLAQETQAANDALVAVGRNYGWPDGWQGTLAVASGLGPWTYTAAYAGVTVQTVSPAVDTPSGSFCYLNKNCLEVTVTQSIRNSFGAYVGGQNTTVSAHSIAYHSGSGGPSNWALYSNTSVSSGNSSESIVGDVYVGAQYLPQSNGQACLGAFYLPGETNSTAHHGHITFGAPQSPPGQSLETVGYGQASPCTGHGAIQAQAPSGDCPAGASWYTNGSASICLVSPAPFEPQIAAPAITGIAPCGGTIAAGHAAGVFELAAGCTLTLDFTNGDIHCVSLVLDNGTPSAPTTVGVSNKKASVSITSYGSSGCPGYGTSTQLSLNRNFLWAAIGSSHVAFQNSSNGCGSITAVTGSLYLPSGSVSFSTNQSLEITGQAFVNSWNVQSGNHPNPIVTYSADNAVLLPEVERLAG